jgi:hypothetical protein
VKIGGASAALTPALLNQWQCCITTYFYWGGKFATAEEYFLRQQGRLEEAYFFLEIS